MATIDLTGGQSAIPFDGLNKLYRIKNRLDFTETNAAVSDVVHAVKVRANSHILKVYVKVATPEGASATSTVGDSANAAGFIASADLNAAPGTITQNTIADAYPNGRIYTSDTDLSVVPAHALSHAIVDIMVVCQDLN